MSRHGPNYPDPARSPGQADEATGAGKVNAPEKHDVERLESRLKQLLWLTLVNLAATVLVLWAVLARA
jgi:hypothetical protein